MCSIKMIPKLTSTSMRAAWSSSGTPVNSTQGTYRTMPGMTSDCAESHGIHTDRRPMLRKIVWKTWPCRVLPVPPGLPNRALRSPCPGGDCSRAGGRGLEVFRPTRWALTTSACTNTPGTPANRFGRLRHGWSRRICQPRLWLPPRANRSNFLQRIDRGIDQRW